MSIGKKMEKGWNKISKGNRGKIAEFKKGIKHPKSKKINCCSKYANTRKFKKRRLNKFFGGDS